MPSERLKHQLTDAELDEAFAYAHGSLRLTAALAELKERRKADLSDEEREALRKVRAYFNDCEYIDWRHEVFTAIDKLIGGGK